MNSTGTVRLGENEKMHSVNKVAAIFNISSDSVRRMIRGGIIKAWRLPAPNRKRRVYNVYRIPESEVQRVFRILAVLIGSDSNFL